MAQRGNRRGHRWLRRAIGVLLLIQAVGFVSAGVSTVDPADPTRALSFAEVVLTLPGLGVVALNLPMLALSLFAFIAGLGFLFRFRLGWLLAMLLQGLGLLYALNLYFFGSRPSFIYFLMIYCIVMVLYLHTSGLQAEFGFRERPE